MSATLAPTVRPPRVRTPSNELYLRVRAELAGSLSAPERRVLEQVGVPQFLSYATVARGERALGRIEMRAGSARGAQQAIEATGLACVRGRFDLLPGADLVSGAQHRAHPVPAGHPGAKAVLYFSRQADFAQGADRVESLGQHDLIARLYGYPDCCVAFFGRASGAQDKTPASVPDLGPHPALLNPLMGALHGIALLMHFPCSPRCAPSRELAARRLAWLRRRAPSLGAFERLATGLALYGPQVGIALATAFEPLGGLAFRLDEVATRSAQSESFLRALRPPIVVRCGSAHEFVIGGLRCRDGQSFVAWYR